MVKKILFVSEDITLAQIVRLKALADCLENEPYEVHFASGNFDEKLLGSAAYRHWPIRVIDKAYADSAVAECRRLYETATLEAYIEDDLRVIREVQPDLIIGDLRLSLPISAKVAGIPFAALINAYWSTEVDREEFPVPDHPLEPRVGYDAMRTVFRWIRPWVFRQFAQPANRLRQRYGLKPIGSLQALLTYGDYVLFPDTPQLVPLRRQAPNQYFLGAIQWSPAADVPASLEPVLAGDYIYATLGSSGRADKIDTLLEGLAQLPLPVILSSAGRFQREVPDNIYLEPWLPGETLAKHALLVVSNGGSTTSYQSLAQGTPVLGIASNLDQYLCMQSLEKLGVARHLRGASFTSVEVTQAASMMAYDRGFGSRAQAIGKAMASYDYRERFRSFLRQVLQESRGFAR
ncbi:nucleotide disphospho-sugar-binding domain-containing protein [Pseudomonas sp.]|uniref:glycosyltransferase n=1 Tax=Pseudomonas sp. TaxID=306 RepID=UPI0019FFB0C9|nr:nucleotide disphospho-sugar-binding domain-containing protein [Pseudomonas sp.]MBF0674670.1 hypothetical protein [Pseudomonas sp.]